MVFCTNGHVSPCQKVLCTMQAYQGQHWCSIDTTPRHAILAVVNCYVQQQSLQNLASMSGFTQQLLHSKRCTHRRHTPPYSLLIRNNILCSMYYVHIILTGPTVSAPGAGRPGFAPPVPVRTSSPGTSGTAFRPPAPGAGVAPPFNHFASLQALVYSSKLSQTFCSLLHTPWCPYS